MQDSLISVVAPLAFSAAVPLAPPDSALHHNTYLETDLVSPISTSCAQLWHSAWPPDSGLHLAGWIPEQGSLGPDEESLLVDKAKVVLRTAENGPGPRLLFLD